MAVHRTLGRRASFWISAAVVAHTLWTSAAPAMTYPLYAAQWHLTPTVTTAIFAVYPVLVVAFLIGFGDLSDFIGRRAAMLWGLAASALGVLLFAIGPDVSWIFAGRALMGVGVGLSASPSAAAMVEFGRPDRPGLASSVTAVAQAFGLMAATLVGGALIQYAPLPTRLNYWVLLVVIAAVFGAAWFLPRHTVGDARGRWRPKMPSVPLNVVRAFTTSTTAMTACYCLGAVMLALGSQVARDLIGSTNALSNGSIMAFFALVVGAFAIISRRFQPETAIALGGASTTVGVGLLSLSATIHSLSTFLAASIAMGVGYSTLFTGGLALINHRAPVHHRAGTLSALFLVAYLMQGAMALGVGVMATAWGLELAIDIGSAAIASLSGGAVLLARFLSADRPT